MNVAIHTTPDGNGAPRAAAALREGLRPLGHDAAVIGLEAKGEDAGLASLPLVRQADVLSLHGFSAPGAAASVRTLLDAGKPVVWTLYDHGPFTGGCRAPGTCTQFERDCAACPQLPDPDAVRTNFALSMKLLRGARLTVAARSRELANAARRSRMFGATRVRETAQGGDPDHVRGHLLVFEEVLADEALPGKGPAAAGNGALAKESPPLPPPASPSSCRPTTASRCSAKPSNPSSGKPIRTGS